MARESVGDAAFWIAVALAGVAGVAFVKLLAGSTVGERVPAIKSLGNFL